jgi:hypothetical protein
MKIQIALVAAAAGILASAATAAAPSTLTLAANPTVVVYGKTTALSGQLAPTRAKQNIGIQGQECGKTSFSKAATAKTAADSTYTATVTPTGATTYKATWKNVTSPTVVVTVRPVVELTRVARGSFTAKVTAGQALTGKYVLFQRYSKIRKRWVQVKKVTLTAATAGPAKPTMISSAGFRAKVAARTRLRVLLTQPQATPCYLSATSNVVRA